MTRVERAHREPEQPRQIRPGHRQRQDVLGTKPLEASRKQELRLASDAPGPLQWQTGIYYFDASFTVTTVGPSGFPPPATLKHDNTSWAVFGQVSYDFTDALTVTVTWGDYTLLDAIDDVLRRYRDRQKAFGGVQLLMIGDLHQLPPIVKDEEWNLLRDYYETMYFFGSKALRQTDPVSIELKHIYRQSDAAFINLLNQVRDNKIDESVLAALNSRYIANFQPDPDAPYITLTAHNASAQEINAEKLAAINQPRQTFQAVLAGDFPASSYPADEILECKMVGL